MRLQGACTALACPCHKYSILSENIANFICAFCRTLLLSMVGERALFFAI